MSSEYKREGFPAGILYHEETEPSEELRGLLETLRGLAVTVEVVVIPGLGPIYNFYNPDGMELKPFLDEKHMPRVTKFSTFIVSEAFAFLKGIPSENFDNVAEEVGGDPEALELISRTAANLLNYGGGVRQKKNREEYLRRAADSLSKIHNQHPIGENDLVVGVQRCGDNLCEELGLERESVDAKRLRFAISPHILGAGINLTEEIAERFRGRRVRLQEGVVASGTTETVFIAAFRNLGIPVEAVDCDAAIVCPAGAWLVDKFKQAVGMEGRDRGTFVCGQLDPDYYVRYGTNEEIFRFFGGEKTDWFIGKQVLGDGGDLTSNTK